MAEYDHFPGGKEVSLRSYEYLRYHRSKVCDKDSEWLRLSIKRRDP